MSRTEGSATVTRTSFAFLALLCLVSCAASATTLWGVQLDVKSNETLFQKIDVHSGALALSPPSLPPCPALPLILSQARAPCF